MNYLRTLSIIGLSLLMLGAATTSAMAQYRGGPPRDPHMNRPGPQRRLPPRPYYHNYNGGYYAAPVYAPPPVIYTPQPSVGINLVLPFHF